MTATTTHREPRPAQVGDPFHATASGLTLPIREGWSEVLTRGQTLTVSADMLQANRRPDGSSVLDLLDDEAQQVARWGQVMIRRGPFPTDAEPWDRVGDQVWKDAREEARRAAWAQPTEASRGAALAAVRERFGDAPTTSTTSMHYGDDRDRWDRQARERDAERQARRGH